MHLIGYPHMFNMDALRGRCMFHSKNNDFPVKMDLKYKIKYYKIRWKCTNRWIINYLNSKLLLLKGCKYETSEFIITLFMSRAKSHNFNYSTVVKT